MLARFIALAQPCLSSVLDLFLDLWQGLDLAFSVLGWLSSILFFLISLPLLLARRVIVAGSVAIFMSSDLRAAVLDLTTAVRQLTSATQSLASALETPRLGSCTSDFVISIIKDSYTLPELEEVSGLLSVRGAEEGPPDVPECI